MILSIQGLPGTGKTTFLTSMLYRFHKQGFTIYSNYHLDFDYKSIYDLDSFLDIEGEKNILAGDELWREIDARNSSSFLNKLASDEVMQLRKTNTHLIDTKQINRLIDVRVREVTSFIIKPLKLLRANGKPVCCRFEITNLVTRKKKNSFYRFYYDGMYMCDMFNTREIIKKQDTEEDLDLIEMAKKYSKMAYNNKQDFASYIWMIERKNYKNFTKSDAKSVVGFINEEGYGKQEAG